MAKNWIAKAIKRPGIEKRRAARAGISVHAQLEKDAHSKNRVRRGEGQLGLRFERGIGRRK
jgi:hypothetical protein